MKRSNRFMAVVAVILVFALTFTGVSIPVNAAATSTVKSITVKNLPSNTLYTQGGENIYTEDKYDFRQSEILNKQ